MTVEEYKVALDALADAKFAEFRQDFGGDFQTRQQFVDHFVHHPEHERRLCQLLGLTTEDDKRTAALTLAAKAHAVPSISPRPPQSAIRPRVDWYRGLSTANKIALWSLVVTIVAVLISLLTRDSGPGQGATVQNSPSSTINQPGRDLIINSPTARAALQPPQRRLLEVLASYQKQFAASRLVVSRTDGRLYFDDDPKRGSDVSLIADLFGSVSEYNAGRFEELVQSVPAEFIRVTSEVRWDNPFVLSVTPAGIAELANR